MQPFRNLLVATDFSPLSEAATARAVSLAKAEGAAIHLLHAIRFPRVATPYEISVPGAVWKGVAEGASEKLEAYRAALQETTQAVVTAELSDTADPVVALVDCIGAREIDLVVMGTHGYSGLRHAFLGSVTERALRTLELPILAVKGSPEEASKPIRRITVATDFSAHADEAIRLAAGLAERLGASLDLVHALELPTDYSPYSSAFGGELIKKIQEEVDGRLESLRADLAGRGLEVTTHCRRGAAPVVISAVAEEGLSELIVMGTRGASGLSHVLLGSVAERTLRAAPCAVLTTKAPGEPEPSRP
ncbi:MAG: universal stress protein [Myxococcota bacterium]|nr:universal stress protein [Myxococcota bacterium]